MSTPRAIRVMSAACVLAAAACVVAGVASADEGYSRSGGYIGVGATWVTDLFEDEVADFASDLAGTPVDVDIDETWGFHGVIGYRVAPIVALEAQYEYIDDFGIGASGSGVSGNVTLEGHALTGNLKLIVPTWRVQPYVLAGVGVVWYSAAGSVAGVGQALFEDDQAFAGRVGAGLDVYLSPHWLVNVGASAVLTTEKVSSNIGADDLDGLHYVGAGASLQYRF